ncbi:putative Ig domain-containing protein [Pseudoalteromonas sp. G4]|uniref:putative Ig domain-containing protein n=1 Tax=Pseudoalteromonas sp. G4 TaxID=2992761 RepID=UPI00237E1C1D|nr:putative Ig domain-containing protein [Pseudoalteromonas sp. G4]MDE3274042.1 putative Ig domain-containing protein [Pseudoalteromonas sp. G4]
MKAQFVKPSLTLLAIALLSACGGSSNDKEETNPPITSTNVAPEITSQAPVSATEDQAYTYQLEINDPDDTNNGSDLNFTLSNQPNGMTISDTGEINWTPVEGILEATNITVSVADGGENGAQAATETFSISVTPVNDAPTISSQASTSATEDILYSYQVVVTDPDDENNGTDLTYSLENEPAGMQISATGKITWTPLEGVLLAPEVVVVVSDGGEDQALSATESFSIDVTPVNDAPVLSFIDDKSVESGNELRFQLEVTDPDDENNGTDLSYQVISAPEGLTISNAGLVSYTSNVAASHTSQVTISVSDGGEDGAMASTQTFNLDELFFVNVTGTAYHYYTNDLLQQAEIKLSNGADLLGDIFTDEQGSFTIRVQDINLSERMVLTGNGIGYGESSLSLNQSDVVDSLSIYIPPVHATEVFDPSVNTTLLVDSEAIVTLPENALVDSEGNLVTTQVTAEISIIDPQTDIDLMPGDMVTTNDSGELLPIESFGAITVDFHDESGELLQLADGKVAQINIPAVGSNKPSVIPLYYYNTNQGIWIEEGEAQLVTADNGKQYYQGNVSHFTTWNADRVYETAYIHGCVVDSNDNAVTGIRVRAEGQSYIGSSSARTNNDGSFSIPVKTNSTTLISTAFGQQSRTLAQYVGSSDITLNECLSLSASFTSIQLNWGEFPYDLDSHFIGPNGPSQADGLFHVYFSNQSVTLENEVIWLDVDDTSSYGPEVISIPHLPYPGTYRYIVHRYSSMGVIDSSETRVELKMGRNRQLFTPNETSELRYWHVFDLVVDDNLNITLEPANLFYNTIPYPGTMTTVNAVLPQISLLKKFLDKKYYAK